MDYVLPEWVQAVISLSSIYLLWLPFLAFCILFLVNFIFCCVQDERLKREYRRKMSKEDLKVLEDYEDNTSYSRVKARLRRIKKNLNTK